jgi:ankyrin repeat protein
MIEVLLDAGADVNQVELRGGMSALHQACFWGLDDAVAILLGRGADPNARDKNGKTPLMYLPGRSTARSIRITEMMLAHGADPNAVDAKGRTLVEQMRAKHLLDEIELLKRHTSEDGAH